MNENACYWADTIFAGDNTEALDYLKHHIYGDKLDRVLGISKRAKSGQSLFMGPRQNLFPNLVPTN